MKRVVGATPIDHNFIFLVGTPTPPSPRSHPDLIPFGTLLPLILVVQKCNQPSARAAGGRPQPEARTVIVRVAISAAPFGAVFDKKLPCVWR